MKSLHVFTIIICMLAVGCIRKQTSMTVKVHVKTGEGEDVSGAIVSVDHESVGETNAFGTLSYSFDAEQGSVHRVDITKESETYYFAPHYETFKAPKKSAAEWNVSAVLYVVPKPRANKANLSEAIDKSENSQPAIAEDRSLAAVKGTKDQGIWAGYPFIDKEEHVASSIDVSVIEDGVDLPQSPSELPLLFTIHTNQGKDPLAKAAVYGCAPGKTPELLCRSNDRGRCVVHDDEATLNEMAAIIVKHPNIKTEVISGPFQKNSNVRANLSAGKSEDYIISYSDFGAKTPVANASVVIANDSSALRSSPCGLVSVVQAKNESVGKTRVRIAHASIKDGSEEVAVDANDRGSNFRVVTVSPAKRRSPRFVVEPVIPGANLVNEDFKLWFDVNQVRRMNMDSVQALKKTGSEAMRLDEFQDQTRSKNHGIAVVERNIKAWDDDRKRLDLATHRIRAVLFRSGVVMSVSIQIFDASAKQVFALKQTVPSTVDFPRLISTTAHAFANAISKGETVKWSSDDDISPVGKWVVVRSPSNAPGEQTWHVVEAKSSFLLKAKPGYLDAELSLSPNAILTLISDPVTFEEDLVDKIYEESSQLSASNVLALIKNVSSDHPQRRKLDLMAAYLESLTGEGSDYLQKIASTTSDDDARMSDLQMNRGIALALLAELEKNPQDIRVKNAVEAIQVFDKMLSGKNATNDAAKRIALFYRGQAKVTLAGLKDDAVMSLDGEADTKEFLKRSDAVSDKDPREDRLKISAAKTLKSLEVQ